MYLSTGQAIVSAVTSGSKRFFLGTDSAPHDRQKKECSCGCAGIYSAPVALSLYAKVFEEVLPASISFFSLKYTFMCFSLNEYFVETIELKFNVDIEIYFHCDDMKVHGDKQSQLFQMLLHILLSSVLLLILI